MSTSPMAAHATWFLVASGTSLAVWGATVVARAAVPGGRAGSGSRRCAVTCVGAAGLLLVLGLLYDVRALASVDAGVVARLIADRGSTVAGIMTVVTTMGDVVMTFVLAGVLAMLTFRRTGRWGSWLLPVAVMVELVVQSAILRVIDSYTFAELMPGLSIGGSDGIPSGGVARLFCLFVLASVLWQPRHGRTASVLVDVAMVLVFVEAMSRLYLGRHLIADVVGGLLLGIALTVGFGWLAHAVDRRWGRAGVRSALR